MSQIIKKLKPLSVNTSTAKTDLTESESPFLRGYEIAISKDGSNNEGGNFGMGKKMSSNFQTIPISLPTTGINKTIGFYEAKELNEAYVINYNSAGQHGIYLLNGVTLTSQAVVIRPGFNFSIDPRYSIPPHRCFLKIVWGIDSTGEKVVMEKYFIFTDSLGWQRQVNVISALATNGYTTDYFAIKGPQNDANELIDYITRPPMYAPVITPVTPTIADQGKQNMLFEKSTQFAYRYIMTDGRATTLSWFSTPYFMQPSTCDVNNSTQPRCLNLGLYAGSALVEQIQIVIRNNGITNNEGLAVDTDWALYDTIYKFSTDGDNDPAIIGNQYWKRTNPWADYNYDPETNTIVYQYCGDKGLSEFSTNDALMVQNDVPLKSAALTPAGDVIIWSDNLRFYPNVPQSTLDNIDIAVVDSGSGTSCAPKIVNITLYATFDSASFSCMNGGGDPMRYFGRVRLNINTNKLTLDIANDSNDYGLNFGTSDGFLCYLAGTSYYSIGTQYKVDASGNKTLIGVIDILNLEQMASLIDLYKSGGYLMQQFDFQVPAGNYIARLARHGAAPTSDYAVTSTYLVGIAKNNNLGNGENFAPNNSVKEMHIDASAGDVDSWTTTRDIFYVFCPYYPGNKGSETYFLKPYGLSQTQSGSSWRIIEGYFRDNIDDNGGIDTVATGGIELVHYYPQLGDPASKRFGQQTDHNGFFFAETTNDDRARNSEIYFDGQFGCNGYRTALFRTQINITNKSGYYPNQIINIGDLDPNRGNYISLKGQLVDCASGIGLSNTGVTMTQGKTYFTDSQGNFEIRVHTINLGTRVENIYVNGNGNCLYNNCDCSIIAPIPYNAAGIACNNAGLRPDSITMPKLKSVSISGSSLKGGGRYPVYIGLADLGGRKWPANLIGYADVPTFLQKGNFNPSKIMLSIAGKLNLPPDAAWVNFMIGKNVNTTQYLQWVGDKIEFIDALGNIVNDGNGAVRARITIQSLLDFNIRENFSTNANYQFVQGDTCRIYDDGQGNLFDPVTNNGYLDYQVLGTDFNETIDQTVTTTTTVSGSSTSTATSSDTYDPKSFIIAYDERLLTLTNKCGFWIELSRNIPQTDNEPAFGISGTYPVVNGEIAPTEILLDAFDTFYQKRNIIISNCSNANLNHPFESQSVTDYWGANVFNDGMVLFKDPLAQQKWYINDSIKSDAFVNEGRVNGLGTCRSENRKNFNDQNWGGIVATKAERNIILFICENDWFTTDYQYNYAHVDQYGRVIANPDNSGIGNPYQKVGANFGCSFEDIATILFDNGMAYWLDRQNSGFILNDFRQATDLAEVDNKGYFIEKIKYLLRYNASINNDLTNIIETCAGINPNTGNVYVSFRPRNAMGQSPVNFVNNEREVFYNLGETFIYNPVMKKWVGWAPFVPEFYGALSQSLSGTEFITFVNGSGWFHNSKGNTGSMRFYGVDTDQVINAVSNFDSSKLKIYQSLALECSLVKYFISKVLTDDANLYSLLSLSHFVKKGGVYYSELLRNMNTYPDPSRPVVSMLQDGKSINGNYCEIQLVSDPNFSQNYNEINNILVRFIGSEKSEK